MKTAKAAITGLFIIVAANSGTALAQSLGQEMNACLAKMVEVLASERAVSSGRGMMAACGCLVNKNRQGLSTRECPRMPVVTESQMRDNFEGNW
jgi:hypothetical protein